MQLVMRLDSSNLETLTWCSQGVQKVAYIHLQWPGLPGSGIWAQANDRAKALTTTFNDDAEKASRPFDASRSGFAIAEGAGLVVLEELSHAKARGAKIYAEILGYGLSSDAHHLTAPPSDGQGAYSSMKRALKNASRNPKEVGYINAHATSTPLGDKAENRAIRRLMCEDGGMQSKDVRISSSKGAIGHLLGGAGSVEAIFTILALEQVSSHLNRDLTNIRTFCRRQLISRNTTKRIGRNGIVITS
jgi:3-oxoacyl-(acyl-carrier-protein) synthase